MSIATLMTDTITVQRKTVGKDSSGGPTEASWPALSGQSDVPADVQPASSDIRMQFLQRQGVVTHTVFTIRDTGARESDRVIFGTKVLVVRGPSRDASAGRNVVWAIDCEEQTQ